MPYIDKIIPLKVEPGIQMDGTDFANANWTLGYWTRFNNRGTPQKIGGFKVITNLLPDIARGITVIPFNQNFRAFIGFSDTLKYQDFDANGDFIGVLEDITPVGFVGDPNMEWDFDILYSSASTAIQLIAHAAPNLSNIANAVEGIIYYGDIIPVMVPLTDTGHSVSGGITVSGAYLFYFGNDGKIAWSEANTPAIESSEEFITGNKILYGLPVRGGQASPATLFWSLNCLVKATFSPDVSGDPDFVFDSITCESSVLSSRGIIEYDSIYYWAATDRFLFYNGIVRELPNDMCLDDFFNNINMSQRQKVFATKVTRWGEIWWFYPRSVAGDLNPTECNAALIYNVRLNKWYPADSHNRLPAFGSPYRYVGRSCGEFEETFSYPVWAANALTTGELTYNLYMQEFGVDIENDGDLFPIPFGIVSNTVSVGITENIDKEILIYRVELDLIQTKDMVLGFFKTGYPRSEEKSSLFDFTANQEKIDLRETARNIKIGFFSPDITEIGSDFQLGKIFIAIRIADQRPLGAPS
jgi:hypothetical protein